MGVDADTNSLPVQTSAVDKVVEATHSTNHPVVNDEKHEGVNGYSPANCPTITSNSFSNSNDFRVLLYFFNASKKSSSSE
jgi:hypothetical protein